MKGYMIDIGITDRQYVAAAVQLLLDTILETNPDATLWLNLLANADSVDDHVEYAGAPSELLEEFRQTDMLGFVIMAGRGSAKASLISVWPPKCFGSKFPYWHVLAKSHDGWDEPFLDKSFNFRASALQQFQMMTQWICTNWIMWTRIIFRGIIGDWLLQE